MSDAAKRSEKQKRYGVIAGVAAAFAFLLLLFWWLFTGPALVEWAETTVPFDPECAADCEIVGYVTPGHRGTPQPLLLNPNVDDPIAQWGRCVQSFTDCMDTTPDALVCIDQGSCPSACKSEYTRLAAAATDLDAHLQAFAEIFLDEGAYCRPEDGSE